MPENKPNQNLMKLRGRLVAHVRVVVDGKLQDERISPNMAQDAHVEFYHGVKVTQGLRLGDWSGVNLQLTTR